MLAEGKKRLRRVGLVVVVSVLAALGSAVVAQPAQAGTGAMIVPASGTVTGGYRVYCDGTDASHHAGIDIANSSGPTVAAAAPGKVISAAVDGTYGKAIVIQHSDGYSTRYAHLSAYSVGVGAQVTQGQQIGVMGSTGLSTGTHLHFEVLINNAAQDLNSAFPCGSAQSKGTPINWSFPGLNPASSYGERYAVIGTDGNLYVKEGQMSSSWVFQLGGVAKVALAGNRIGVVTTDGHAFVKEGDLYAGWVDVMSSGIRDIDLDGNRVAVVGADNILYVKEGGLNAGWTTVATDTAQVSMSGSRIGVRFTGGGISVKDGGLGAPWVAQGSGTDVSLSGSRIGVVWPDGVVRVKEGDLYAPWVAVVSGSDVELDGSRVGVLGAGTLIVKDGGLSAGWTTQLGGVTQFSLGGDKMGLIADSKAFAKKGDLYAGWQQIMPNSKQVVVAN